MFDELRHTSNPKESLNILQEKLISLNCICPPQGLFVCNYGDVYCDTGTIEKDPNAIGFFIHNNQSLYPLGVLSMFEKMIGKVEVFGFLFLLFLFLDWHGSTRLKIKRLRLNRLDAWWTGMGRPFPFDCSSQASQLSKSSVNTGVIVQVKPASSSHLNLIPRVLYGRSSRLNSTRPVWMSRFLAHAVAVLKADNQ